jgi:predicted nuclease of predicted toxin-antitoxin system
VRFLIDECLHESLVGLAHAAGLEAVHVNHLGLSGKPDWTLAERIVKDEFTFVTNNRMDFTQLFGKMELHAGLMVLVPNVTPLLQRALFHGALEYSAGRSLVNVVIEVRLKGQMVRCAEYPLSAEWSQSSDRKRLS